MRFKTIAPTLATLTVGMWISGLAWSSPQTGIDYISDYDIKEQPPYNGTPGTTNWTEEDALGVSSDCEEEEQNSNAKTVIEHGMSDRVLLHSGQEVRTETDLFVEGRDHGVDLVLRRRHTSRRLEYGTDRLDPEGSVGSRTPDSPFGPGWAFNYDHQFTPATQDSKTLTFRGYGRDDTFEWVDEPGSVIPGQAGSSFYVSTGGRMDRGEYRPSEGRFYVYRTGGSRLVFEVESTNTQSGVALEGRMVQVLSPNGNRISIAFDTAATNEDFLQQDIVSLLDSWGREYTFVYGKKNLMSGAHPWVTEIQYDGQAIVYEYHEVLNTAPGRGSLTSKTTPPSTGANTPLQSNIGGIPGGRKTSYDYFWLPTSGVDNRINYALKSITSPNLQSTGDSFLAWTYCSSTSDPECVGFVKTHTVGNPSPTDPQEPASGGTFTYSYAIHPSAPTPPFIMMNDPVLRVTVTDRSGTQSVLDFNQTGQLLREEVAGQWATTHTYAPSGLLEETRYPEGNEIHYTYGDVGASGTLLGSERNATQIQMVPDSGRQPSQGAIASITEKIIYEPVYNKPYKVVDPRGIPGNEAAFTTVFIYDYMEDLASSMPAIAARLGINDTDPDGAGPLQSPLAELESRLAALGIGSVGEVNGDGIHQDCGQLIQVVYPTTSVIDSTASGTTAVEVSQAASEVMAYNGFGQMVFHENAEGELFAWEYLDEDDVDGNSATMNLPVNAIANGVAAASNAGGFGRSWYGGVTISGTKPDFYSDLLAGAAPTSYLSRSLYEYGPHAGLGLPGNARGHFTKLTDGRGISHLRHVNELDEVVSVYEAADAPTGLTALSYQHVFAYDANGNLVLELEPDDDPGQTGGGFVETAYSFDALDELITVVRDSQGIASEHRYAYTSSEMVARVDHYDNSVISTSQEYTYDARQLMVTRTRGVHSQSLSSTVEVTSRDLNGNVLEWRDASGGHVEQFKYDGYDREYESTDRDGTVAFSILNENGFPTMVRISGDYGSFPVLNGTLAVEHFVYDERNRVKASASEEFWYPGYLPATVAGLTGPQGGDWGLPASTVTKEVPGSELLWSAAQPDRLGRVIGVVDSDGDRWATVYDALSRPISATEPDGSSVLQVYDANSNVLSRVRREVPSDPALLPIGAFEDFKESFEYDARNRAVLLHRHEDPLLGPSQTTSLEFDPRDNLVQRVDAFGNVSRYSFDNLDRLVRSESWLGIGGQGADPDIPGSITGSVVTESTWDDLNRLKSRTDDRGNQTAYFYDDLGRQQLVLYADGQSEEFEYNEDDELAKLWTRQDAQLNFGASLIRVG